MLIILTEVHGSLRRGSDQTPEISILLERLNLHFRQLCLVWCF